MALSLQRYTRFVSSDWSRILKERTEKEQERSVTVIKVEDHLPENVIVEILSWLPVKVLLQFKSVCKSCHEVYGFGYDPVTEDYKVVVIKGYWNKSYDDENKCTHPLSVLVYSLRTHSWRYWGDLAQTYELYQSKCYIVINGCFYWLGSHVLFDNSEFIISFDMGADAIQEIQLPSYDQPASETLGIYDDCLAFLAVHGNEKRFEIWTWSEGIWTKKFTMESISDVQRPVGHWKKNKLILECDSNRLVLCDSETEEIKDLAFQWYTRCEGVFVFRESLLSVKDNKKAETDSLLDSEDINKVSASTQSSKKSELEEWAECSTYDIDLLFSDQINN